MNFADGLSYFGGIFFTNPIPKNYSTQILSGELANACVLFVVNNAPLTFVSPVSSLSQERCF